MLEVQWPSINIFCLTLPWDSIKSTPHICKKLQAFFWPNPCVVLPQVWKKSAKLVGKGVPSPVPPSITLGWHIETQQESLSHTHSHVAVIISLLGIPCAGAWQLLRKFPMVMLWQSITVLGKSQHLPSSSNGSSPSRLGGPWLDGFHVISQVEVSDSRVTEGLFVV